jgi:hypothetical protein
MHVERAWCEVGGDVCVHVVDVKTYPPTYLPARRMMSQGTKTKKKHLKSWTMKKKA